MEGHAIGIQTHVMGMLKNFERHGRRATEFA